MHVSVLAPVSKNGSFIHEQKYCKMCGNEEVMNRKFMWFSSSIGIKHDFPCINICWTLRSMLFDCYYCIKTFSNSNILEKMLRKVAFLCLQNGAERHVTCECFENTASRAKTNVIFTSQNSICYCARYWL